MGYVVAQSLLPKWMGRRIEPSVVDLFRVMRILKSATTKSDDETKPKRALEIKPGCQTQ